MTPFGDSPNRIPPPGARVLVAMSGGADSAAVAALLARRGCDCIGATLRLVPEPPEKSPFEPCCGLDAAVDAARVCARLGIPHEVLHAVDRFDRDIIARFVREYAAGRTPNPCIRCNRMIKFGALYERARALGCEWVAMGHYARLEERGGRMALRRARHRAKDQSYVLAPLTQPQLRRACFPLGDMTKEEARAAAGGIDRRSGEKPESQEICFVFDDDYARLVEERTGPFPPGPILDRQDNMLGTHHGLVRYTLGQRRGLGIAAPRPLYVIGIDSGRNALIVGHDEDTFCDEFTTGPLFWGTLPKQTGPFDCLAQLRSRHTPGPARVVPGPASATVTLPEPQRAVTPGQWAAFYDDEGYVLAAAEIRTVVRFAGR